MNVYTWSKLVHVVSLIFWIGPPLGAYYLLLVAWRSKDKERIVWAERMSERVLIAEHIALPFLLGSGVLMLWATEWRMLEVPWMARKLWLLGYVMLFELVDIWVSHRVMHKVFKLDDPFSSPDWDKANRARVVMFVMAAPVAFICLPGIFFSAVMKL